MDERAAQWENCSPEAMAGMSKAAIAFAFADAKKDQLSLRAEIERLRETLNFIATHLSSDWPERCQCAGCAQGADA